MRKSIASFALIKRVKAGNTEWLAQWNANWNTLNFVGGHKHEDESFRECVIREITEELHLTAEADFVVADVARARLRYSAWSKGAGEPTEYTMELFDARLCTDDAEQRVAGSSLNRWLLEQEIKSLETADGISVSETMSMLFGKARLWTTHDDG